MILQVLYPPNCCIHYFLCVESQAWWNVQMQKCKKKKKKNGSWPWTLRHTWWQCDQSNQSIDWRKAYHIRTLCCFFAWTCCGFLVVDQYWKYIRVNRPHIQNSKHWLHIFFPTWHWGNHLLTLLCVFYPHDSLPVWVRHWKLQVVSCPSIIDISQIQSVFCHGTSWRVCSATSPLVPIYPRCCLTFSRVQKHHFYHQASDIKWEKTARILDFWLQMFVCCIWSQPTRTTTGFSRNYKKNKWHWNEEMLSLFFHSQVQGKQLWVKLTKMSRPSTKKKSSQQIAKDHAKKLENKLYFIS